MEQLNKVSAFQILCLMCSRIAIHPNLHDTCLHDKEEDCFNHLNISPCTFDFSCIATSLATLCLHCFMLLALCLHCFIHIKLYLYVYTGLCLQCFMLIMLYTYKALCLHCSYSDECSIRVFSATYSIQWKIKAKGTDP